MIAILTRFCILLAVALACLILFVLLHGHAAVSQLHAARALHDVRVHGTTAAWQLEPGRGMVAGSVSPYWFAQFHDNFPRLNNFGSLFPPRGPNVRHWALISLGAAVVAMAGALAGTVLARLWGWPRYDNASLAAAGMADGRGRNPFRAAALSLVAGALSAPLVWWLTVDRSIDDFPLSARGYPAWPAAYVLGATVVFVTAALISEALSRAARSARIDPRRRRCERCGYESGLLPRCPECGHTIDNRRPLIARRPNVRRVIRWGARCALSLLAVGALGLIVSPERVRLSIRNWVLVREPPPADLNKSYMGFRWYEYLEITTRDSTILLHVSCVPGYWPTPKAEPDMPTDERSIFVWACIDLRSPNGLTPIIGHHSEPSVHQNEPHRLARFPIDVPGVHIDIVADLRAWRHQLVSSVVTPRLRRLRRIPFESNEYMHERHLLDASITAHLETIRSAADPRVSPR